MRGKEDYWVRGIALRGMVVVLTAVSVAAAGGDSNCGNAVFEWQAVATPEHASVTESAPLVAGLVIEARMVPEPATIAWLGIGTALVVLTTRRKRGLFNR